MLHCTLIVTALADVVADVSSVIESAVKIKGNGRRVTVAIGFAGDATVRLHLAIEVGVLRSKRGNPEKPCVDTG